MKKGVRILSGNLKGRLIPIVGKNIRPATGIMKKRIFDIISKEIKDSNVLDLFSGSGNFGFESISRGASTAIFVEKNRKRYFSILKICKLFNVIDIVQMYCKDVIKYLEVNNTKADIIFVDPPYDFLYIDKLSIKLYDSIVGKPLIIWHFFNILPDLNLFQIERKIKQGQSNVYFLRK